MASEYEGEVKRKATDWYLAKMRLEAAQSAMNDAERARDEAMKAASEAEKKLDCVGKNIGIRVIAVSDKLAVVVRWSSDHHYATLEEIL